MLRVITINANGIRSATQKGLFSWISKQNADFICIQELKAQQRDLPEELQQIPGYHYFAHYAEKKGYSGCAIYSRHVPINIQQGFGSTEFDPEGRFVSLEFPNLVLVSTYFPSGSSSDERQQAKFRFLDEFLTLQSKLKKGKEIILCGDINIAHKEIDLKNWKGNLKNSGFLPEERNWLTHLFDHEGWVDVFRLLKKEGDLYTWWSNRGQARAKNVGWRIDYHIATPQVASSAKSADIYTQERFSDHAPLTIDYDWSIE